jgi:hypothetical protein
LSDQGRQSEETARRAIEALLAPERFRDAERRVNAAMPQLQQVLAGALAEGGYFDADQRQQMERAVAVADPDERMIALRTLLAEEVRVAMMVGVAVGWELARELGGSERDDAPSAQAG